MSANKGKHKDDPRPIFLKPDRVPTGKNWSTTRPDRTKFIIVRIRSIAFTQGVSIRFYETRPRPVPDAERLVMKVKAKKKLRAILKSNESAARTKLRKKFRPKKAEAVR